MGIKVAFSGDANLNCSGKGPEFTMAYLKSKEHFWNEFMATTGTDVYLESVLKDLDYDKNTLARMLPYDDFNNLLCGYWSANDHDAVDFGVSFNEGGDFLLNFNCRVDEERLAKIHEDSVPKKKPCYFWNVYKYHVDTDQLTLKGFIEWCNELYAIQYKKPRPKNNRIFVNPDMKIVTVNARFWNKDKIEKWLNDHGYTWTKTVEKRYQYHFDNPDDVELIDSDAELKARQTA